MLNSKKRGFRPIFLNRYLSNEKDIFADNSSVEPAIFSMEKLSVSMKLFSGHFYGQSFIKTVRGPLMSLFSILVGATPKALKLFSNLEEATLMGSIFFPLIVVPFKRWFPLH